MSPGNTSFVENHQVQESYKGDGASERGLNTVSKSLTFTVEIINEVVAGRTVALVCVIDISTLGIGSTGFILTGGASSVHMVTRIIRIGTIT